MGTRGGTDRLGAGTRRGANVAEAARTAARTVELVRVATVPFATVLVTTILVATGLIGSVALGQPRTVEPHLAYAFPAGCRRGETCQIVLGGQHIKDVKGAYVAGGGVTAEIVRWYRPLTRGEYNQLRMALEDARKKLEEEGKQRPTEAEVAAAAKVTEEQLREMEIYRQRDRDAKRQPNDQLEEELTIQVTVAEDAEPGRHELRLLTEDAVSNPLWLHVGVQAEARETEPNDQTPDPAIQEFPVVVNGQIMPGDTDSFAIQATQGMRLVIVAGARDIIPYLADAVPGWFQPVLSMTDPEGQQVVFNSAYHFHQDPVVYFEVPRDGKYTLRIHDALYRGREDFVYRLLVGEIPFVTSIFPLGAPWDERTTIELTGWNLSQKTLQTKAVAARQIRPLQWYTVPQADGQEVRVPVRVDSLKELRDHEPNNTEDAAQKISVGTIINGRIDEPGDEDVFFVTGGGKVSFEVHARRHGSPLDAQLLLTDSHGKEIGFNDDYEDKAQALLTHHADAHLVATVPTSGAYLRLSDVQGQGGPDFVYRLYVRSPKPDFELRVTPASILARPGSATPITVHALRQDDFQEDIELALVDAPPGVALSGGVIPGNANRVQLTLHVPPKVAKGPLVLELAGRAHARRSQAWITRPALPAEDMMQAFIWHHLIPVEQWTLIVSGNPVPVPPFQLLVGRPHLDLPVEGEVLVPVQVGKNVVSSELKVELKEPKGISAEFVEDTMGNLAAKLKTEGGKLTPGLRGNLLLYAYRMVTPAPNAENRNPKPWRAEFGYLPAVPFEIVARKPSR
ncbi:MAG: peptidase [Pirellulales bacterium]